MFKTLLALALTVNLAASLSCISGTRYVYGAGCDDVTQLDSSSFESVDYGSSYDGCVTYSYDTDYGTGCSFTTITSGPYNTLGCDLFAITYGSFVYSNFECSDCATDDCNDEYVSDDSSGSGAGSPSTPAPSPLPSYEPTTADVTGGVSGATPTNAPSPRPSPEPTTADDTVVISGATPTNAPSPRPSLTRR